MGTINLLSHEQKFHIDIIKLEIVLEEADESLYWLEIIQDAAIVKNIDLSSLIKEANELTAIFAAADKTAKSNRLKK